jgi:hypothetical protein
LLGGLLIIGTYYLVARLVFPRDHTQWPDFDDYYFQHKNRVLEGVVACNFAANAATMALGAPFFANDVAAVSIPLFYLLCLGAMLTQRSSRFRPRGGDRRPAAACDQHAHLLVLQH